MKVENHSSSCTLYFGDYSPSTATWSYLIQSAKNVKFFITSYQKFNNSTIYSRGAQIPGARSPWQLNFVQLHLTSVGPQHGIGFVSLFWNLEIRNGSEISGKYVHPCFIAAIFIVKTHKYHSYDRKHFSQTEDFRNVDTHTCICRQVHVPPPLSLTHTHTHTFSSKPEYL